MIEIHINFVVCAFYDYLHEANKIMTIIIVIKTVFFL